MTRFNHTYGRRVYKIAWYYSVDASSGCVSRQYVDGAVALCENRCDGYGAYYPHFNYVVSDCVRGATVASGDAFWTDAQTHVTQRGVCVARAVVSKTSAWAEGTVVTKETVRAYIQALERAGAVMGLCG